MKVLFNLLCWRIIYWQCLALLSVASLCCSSLALAANGASRGSATAPTSTMAAGNTSERWDNLLLGTWDVPAGNLLAYLVGPTASHPLSITDQTIFHITTAHGGHFSGTISVRLSDSSPLGWTKAQPMYYILNGLVTPQGDLRITFTPTESGQPTVTGVGAMQFVDGSWRMTMQVEGGSSIYLLHWAYMTKNGTSPPRNIQQLTEKWYWLPNTHWALTDSQLGRFIFTVTDYQNGYFWGKGFGSTPVSVAGSVTPEGRLLFVFTQNGSMVTREGEVVQTSEDYRMQLRSYQGTQGAGTARLLQW